MDKSTIAPQANGDTREVRPAQDENDKKFTQQRQITSAYKDKLAAEQRVNNLTAKIIETRKQMPEFKELERLDGEIEAARIKLSQAEGGNKQLNDLKDERSKHQREVRDSKRELSNLLIRFAAKYSQRSLKVESSYRAIDIKATIGKALEEQAVLPL